MFNPKSFKASKPKTLTLCNSAHSLAERANMVAKLVPGLADTFYVVANDNSWCATIDTHAMTLGVYPYGQEELRKRIEEEEFLGEVVNLDPKNKWIANDIVKELEFL